MKPLLLLCALAFFRIAFTQSLDYISVQKQNGRVIKNFYTGSNILLQTTDGSYLEGLVKTIRNDSVFVTLYNIRYMPTVWGGYVRDTIATTVAGIRYGEIKSIHLRQKQGFWKRRSGPLLMLGGGGYLALNVLNGALFDLPVTDRKNLRRVGIAVGAFGLGCLLKKLFQADGFSKKSHRIVYIDF